MAKPLRPRKQLRATDFGWASLHANQHRDLMALVRDQLWWKLPDHMAVFLRRWLLDAKA